MTAHEAMTFLRRHQPMPNDADLTSELIGEYDRVREYFLQHPTLECVPLFLNSFGEGGGMGVYQLVEDVIRLFAPVDVIPHLVRAMQSSRRGVRYWSTQIAALFPVPELMPMLSTHLHDSDADTRYAAITALEQIENVAILGILKDALAQETDDDIRELLSNIIKEKET